MRNYSLYGSSVRDPRIFMIQALTKCLLNNEKIIEAIPTSDDETIKSRVSNSVRLIEVMDAQYLNKDSGNETVIKVSALFDWFKRELEMIPDQYKGKEEMFIKKMEQLSQDIENLRDGFKGMKDV